MVDLVVGDGDHPSNSDVERRRNENGFLPSESPNDDKRGTCLAVFSDGPFLSDDLGVLLF